VAVGGGPFPAESLLGPAAVKFVERFPKVSVQLFTRDWDDLLQQLRSRELDFFVAETSTLQREADLEIVPMARQHAVHVVARAGHPLAARRDVTLAETFEYPWVTPSRIPPRLLDPLLASHRQTAKQSAPLRPFPSIQCQGLAPVKRILATSDAVTGSILSCIATELESGKFVLLVSEPWLHLQYGIVSLKGRPWTHAAQKFHDYVLEAEAAVSLEEGRLVARFGAGSLPV
jgi:DNA-binding transcriptional LysR family regulator